MLHTRTHLLPRYIALLLLSASMNAQSSAAMQEFNRACRMVGQGHPREALPILAGIITRTPDHIPAYDFIIEAYRNSDDAGGALRFFDELESKHDVPAAYLAYGRGRAHLAVFGARRALPYVRQCIKSLPRWLGCYSLAGAVYSSRPDASLIADVRRVVVADPLNAAALFGLADLYRKSGRKGEAVNSYRAGSRAGPDDPGFELEALHRMGDAAPDLGVAAARMLDLAIQLGDEDAELSALGWLGGWAQSQGDKEGRQRWLDRSKARAQEMENPRRLAAAYSAEAAAYREQGDAATAIQLYQQALAIHEKASGSHDISNCLRELAECEVRAGDNEQALKHLKRAQKAAVASGSAGNIAFVTRGLAVVHSNLGDYGKAIELLLVARRLFARIGLLHTAGSVVGDLGAAYEKLADYSKAASHYRESLRSARRFQDHGDQERLLTRLGNLELERGDRIKAVQYLRQSLALSPRTSNTRFRIRTNVLLGMALARGGSFAEAARLLERGRSDARSIHDVSIEITALIALGDVDLRRSRLALAQGAFEAARELAERSGATEPARQAHLGLGDAARRRGRLPEAESHYTAAMAAIESVRGRLISTEFRTSFFGSALDVYERMIDLLAGQGKSREALEVAERARTRALLDILGGSRTGSVETPLGAPAIEEQAARHQALVLQYALGRDRSWVWAIGGGRIILAPLPGRSAIETLVRRYRELLIAGSAEAAATGRALYGMLVRPVESKLGRDASVIVVPDGALHYLPFETLRAAQGSYFGERFTVSYAPSASVLSQLASRAAPPADRKELLAYGDPDFSGAPLAGAERDLLRAIDEKHGLRFYSLPGSRREVEEIAGLFGKSRVTTYFGAAATRSSLARERLLGYKRIHFATHAFVDEASPERSGIALANTEAGDTLLRVGDITKLKLNADLVVLSGCRTGLGKLIRGEGVAGLTRAFLHAGAARVVVSLWEVNDVATAEFMKLFYGRIQAGQTPATALRSAKAAMNGSPVVAYRDPKFWAPFVLVGQP